MRIFFVYPMFYDKLLQSLYLCSGILVAYYHCFSFVFFSLKFVLRFLQ